MTRRLDTNLDHRVDRQHLDDVGDDLRQRRPGHRTPRSWLEQRCTGRIGDRERELGLANIDRDDNPR